MISVKENQNVIELQSRFKEDNPLMNLKNINLYSPEQKRACNVNNMKILFDNNIS